MIDKATLLAQRYGVETVDIPGVGSVKIRGLTRGEVFEIRGQKFSETEFEQQLLARAMVEPELTAEDVKAWQDNSPAREIDAVVEAVVKLSGLEVGSDKSGLPGTE